MTERNLPPEKLVDEHGNVCFGVFDFPCKNINLDETRLKVLGCGMPGSYSRFRLKEWQHFTLQLPGAFMSLAIVDAKFMKTTWFHYVNLEDGTHFEHARKGPTLGVRIARELWNDTTSIELSDYAISIANRLDHGAHEGRVTIAEAKGKPAVEAEFKCLHDLDAIQPLVVVLPVGPNRGMYSHKVALPVTGWVKVGERTFEADENSFAILDIHKAHYPRHTWWNWATFAGRDAAGRALAFNLTRNVNERDDELNENAFWVDGRITHLGPGRFEFDRKQILEPWHLTTVNDELDLTFTPMGERQENTRLGVARSVFHQPYGKFSGTVTADGETYEIDGMMGVCEDHDALW